MEEIIHCGVTFLSHGQIIFLEQISMALNFFVFAWCLFYRPSNILTKFMNDMETGSIGKRVEERIKIQNLSTILYINYTSI